MNAPPLDASEFGSAARPGIGDAAAGPSPGALRAMTAFADHMQVELRRGLEAGVPYPILRDGRVAWVHPGGTLRTGLAADSAPLAADAA